MSLLKKTKEQLKELCDQNEIFVTGKELKKELIERLTEKGVGSPVKKSKPLDDDTEKVTDDTESETEEGTPAPGAPLKEKALAKVASIKSCFSSKVAGVKNTVLKQNGLIKEVLASPCSVVTVQLASEVAYIYSNFFSTVAIGKLLPKLVTDNLPKAVLSVPIIDLSFLVSVSFISFLAVYLLTLALPAVAAYYVNYSVKTFDPVVFSASRALLSYVVLTTPADALSSLKSEFLVLVGFGDYGELLQHFFLSGALQYDLILGKIGFIGSLFSAFISLYGSVAP